MAELDAPPGDGVAAVAELKEKLEGGKTTDTGVVVATYQTRPRS